MEGDDEAVRSLGTLRWAIRTTGIAALFALAAAHHFAHPDVTNPEPTRIAQSGTGRSVVDPETTGSIAQNARAARLDPCGLPVGMRTLRP